MSSMTQSGMDVERAVIGGVDCHDQTHRFAASTRSGGALATRSFRPPRLATSEPSSGCGAGERCGWSAWSPPAPTVPG